MQLTRPTGSFSKIKGSRTPRDLPFLNIVCPPPSNHTQSASTPWHIPAGSRASSLIAQLGNCLKGRSEDPWLLEMGQSFPQAGNGAMPHPHGLPLRWELGGGGRSGSSCLGFPGRRSVTSQAESSQPNQHSPMSLRRGPFSEETLGKTLAARPGAS